MSKFIFAETGVINAVANFKCAAFEEEGGAAAVDNFSNPNADIMAEIKKEEEERVRNEQKNAAKIQLQKDSFEQELNVIELRKDRKQAEAKAKKTKSITAENEKYQAGGVDTETHQKNLDDIRETYEKECQEADREYRKAYDNLRTKNPEGYNRYRGW